MEPDTEPSHSRWQRAKPWLIWLGIGAVLVGLLSGRLADRVSPWELVLTIPSGFDEKEYSGTGIYPPPRIIDIAPGQRHLVTARPDGTCERWDLESLAKVATFGEPFSDPERDEDLAAFHGASNLRHTADGRVLAAYRDRWLLFDPSGKPLEKHNPEDWAMHLAISPDGKKIANSSHWPSCYDLKSRENRLLVERGGFNGGRTRFQWFSDNRRLLFNDAVTVMVHDTSTNEVLFRHRHLDVRLPPPMITDGTNLRNEDHVAARKYISYLVDSQLADGEAKIASLYETDGLLMGTGDPGANRFRFYDSRTGALLMDEALPYDSECLRISPDRTRAYVLMDHRDTNCLWIYDTRTMTMLDEVRYTIGHFAHHRMTPLADNRTMISEGNRLVMLDLQEEFAPIKMHDWPSNVIQVESTDDARTIVVAQNTKDVHIWKKRRPLSRWGALVLWEYHLAYLLGIVCICGPLIQIGRRSQRRIGESFPAFFWAAILLLGISLGHSMVNFVVEPITARFYDMDYERSGFRVFTRIGGMVLWFFILAGMVQLKNGWRTAGLVGLMIASVLITIMMIGVYVRLQKLGALSITLPVTFDNGVRLEMNTGWTIFAFAPTLIIVPLATWWALFHKRTRVMFETPAPDSAGEAPVQ